jgi:serine/threonine protein kinase
LILLLRSARDPALTPPPLPPSLTGDLGVAKVLDSSTAFAQSLVGTPYYLSPELCADQPYRDKSDVWAFGVILYEVLGSLHRSLTSLSPCLSLSLSLFLSSLSAVCSLIHSKREINAL